MTGAESVDEYCIGKMTSPLPARKVPGLPECGWCDVGKP